MHCVNCLPKNKDMYEHNTSFGYNNDVGLLIKSSKVDVLGPFVAKFRKGGKQLISTSILFSLFKNMGIF